jgi:cytochrome c oxidase assembly factor CtaG
MPGPMSSMLPPLTFGRFLTSWQFSLGWSLLAAALVAAYLAGLIGARRNGHRWPVLPILAWLVGVALVVIATQGAIAVYGDGLFWLHMVGHLTLIMVAPLALLWGRPLDLAVAAAGRHGGAVTRGLQHPVVSVLTCPLVTLGLYTIVIVGTHLTGFMNTMMSHPWVRSAESAAYLVSGLLFFAPIATDAPIRWRLSPPTRMFLLAVAMPVDTFTGVILIQTDRYPWPMMAAGHPSWAMSLIDDLHAGGAVMWIGGDAIMAVLIGVAAVAWARAAGSGANSELGGWLSAARVNYQRTVVEGADAPTVPTSRTGDSDEDLADYNAYLARLNARDH